MLLFPFEKNVALFKVGITQTIINYLRQAIAAPCGLDALDYTMCCEG